MAISNICSPSLSALLKSYIGKSDGIAFVHTRQVMKEVEGYRNV